jgi:phosphohistidine phosphatase SixA
MDLLRCSIAVLCAAAGLSAQAQPTDRELASLLRDGGLTIYFRHGVTDPLQQDKQGRDYADCSKQRNLSNAGRRQAQATGEAIRAAGLPIGDVISSPYCRAFDTATLIFGRADRSADVLPRMADGKPDYEPLVKLVSTPPAAGKLRVVVGHNAPRIARLEEGEAAVVKPMGDGFEVVALIGARRWRELFGP